MGRGTAAARVGCLLIFRIPFQFPPSVTLAATCEAALDAVTSGHAFDVVVVEVRARKNKTGPRRALRGSQGFARPLRRRNPTRPARGPLSAP